MLKRITAIAFVLAFAITAAGQGVNDTLIIKTAVVTSRANPVKMQEDTLIFNPSAYRLPEDASLEDLLNKIPGLEINGNTVTLQGKEIQHLYINGRRFQGNDIKTGLQMLQADMVSRVHAYEDKTDFARISGIDDGERVPVLDVKIKESMMKNWRGNLSAGAGTQKRYDTGVSGNKIDKDAQQSLLLRIDNLPATTSMKVTSRGQVGAGAEGERKDWKFNYSIGRTKTEFEYDASVNYTGIRRDVLTQTRTENVSSSGTNSFSNSNGSSLIDSHVLKANGRFIWRPQKTRTIVFKPRFQMTISQNEGSTQGSSFKSDPYAIVEDPNALLGFDIPGDPLKGIRSNSTDNRRFSYSNNIIASADIQWTDRNILQKKGRSFTVRAFGEVNHTKTIQHDGYKTRYYLIKKNPDSLQVRDPLLNAPATNCSFLASASYNEPIAKKLYLQFTLEGKYDVKRYSRQTELSGMYDPSLSYDSRFNSYLLRFNANFRYSTKKINLLAGVRLTPQWTSLNYGTQKVDAFAFYAAPNISLRYNPDKANNLTFTYTSGNGTPSLYNLVPLASGLNPLSPHIGNAYLKPPFTHRADLSYRYSNIPSQSSLVLSAGFRTIINQIVNSVTYDQESGVRSSTPQNLSGNWSANASVIFNKTWRAVSLSNTLGGEYQNNLSYLYNSKIKESELNRTGRLMIKEKLEISWRNSWLELTPVLGGEYTSEASDLRPDMDQSPWAAYAGLETIFTLPWGMRVTANFQPMVYGGNTWEELNRCYWVLDAGIAQPLFKKKLTLRLDAHDLLRELPCMTRSFGAQSRTITIANGVNSYILLKLVYRFKIK